MAVWQALWRPLAWFDPRWELDTYMLLLLPPAYGITIRMINSCAATAATLLDIGQTCV